MLAPPSPANEQDRLRALRALGILYTPPNPELDRITRTAARVFGVPVSYISLIDADRQWFISRHGLSAQQTSRDIAICAHTILGDGPLVVTDASRDERFSANPIVTATPFLRFYAGHPLRTRSGHTLGSLCVAAQYPRNFDDDDAAALADLAALTEQYFHRLETSAEAEAARDRLDHNERLLARTLVQAAVGVALATPDGRLLEFNDRFCELVGHPREQLASMPVRRIIHPDDVDDALNLARTTLSGRHHVTGHDVRFIRADGETTWTQVGVSALTDRCGRPEHVIVVATDINEHKRVETELHTLQQGLEQRIAARTRQLDAAITELRAEVASREEAQQELETAKEHFRATLEHATDAFIETDEHGRIVMWNQAASSIFGWSRDEALGRDVADLIIPESLRPMHENALRRFVEIGSGTLGERRIETEALRRTGETFPIELTHGSVQHGEQRLVHAFIRDISHRRDRESALRESQRQLETITDNVPALIAHIDPSLRYRFHNRMYREWFELPEGGLVGRHIRESWGDEHFAEIEPTLQRVLRGQSARFEYRLEALSGEMWFYASLVPSVDCDGNIDGFYVLSQDITERKRLLQQLEHDVLHDALTGLPNRRLLMTYIAEAMARVRRERTAVAVLFMDLDDFKTMNDVLGHEFGDAVLMHFAQAIRSGVRECDRIARLAGDEFVVIMEGLDPERAESAVEGIAKSLMAQISTTREILGVEVSLSTSIGIAIHNGREEETPQELLTRSDTAMYRAKAAGKHQLSF